MPHSSILTSLLFLGILGYFGWSSLHYKDSFLRTYSRNSISTITSSFLFFLSVSSLLIAHLDLIDFRIGSSTIAHSGDIIFTIDISKSMDTQDISSGEAKISRLDTVKKFLLNYIASYPENRYGIILFAGKSLISSPLTTDAEMISNIISSLDSKTIREGGTNLEDAISLSIARFSHTMTGTTQPKSNTLLFLSDGGEIDDISSWERIDKAVTGVKDIQFLIAGFGTKEGSTIPLGRDIFGNTIIKMRDGREIISALGTENLERLASITHASLRYYDSIDQEDDFNREINTNLQTITRKIQRKETGTSSGILLFASSLLLLASFLTLQIKK